MTLVKLREKTLRMLHNRSDATSAIIDEAINNAYRLLARGKFVDSDRTRRVINLRFPELEAISTAITLENGTNQYAYPATAAEVDAVEYESDTTNGIFLPLKPVSWTRFSAVDTSRNQAPTLYTLHNRNIYVTPWPGAQQDGRVLRVWYYITPTALTGDSQEPIIPAVYHPLIPLLAARELYVEFGEEERATSMFSTFLARLNEIQGPRSLRTLGHAAYNRTTNLER